MANWRKWRGSSSANIPNSISKSIDWRLIARMPGGYMEPTMKEIWMSAMIATTREERVGRKATVMTT
jgi:hypothetical protein